MHSMGFSFHSFLFVLAVVLFVLAGLGVPESARFKYIGWGLALWAMSLAITV